MGLIFLIIVIIVVLKLSIKLLQRGDSQPSNYSEDYRQGYWDAGCVMHKWMRKIE